MISILKGAGSPVAHRVLIRLVDLDLVEELRLLESLADAVPQIHRQILRGARLKNKLITLNLGVELNECRQSLTMLSK